MELKIAYGNSRMSKKWSNKKVTFEALCEWLKTTQRTTETVEEYMKMPKARRDEIKDVGGFVLGHLRGGRRKKDTVESRSGLTLDIDHADKDFLSTVTLDCPYKCAIYSTHSHTSEEPRLRLIIPTSREMSPEEYAAVSRLFAAELGMDYFDDSTYEPERLMHRPSTPSDGEYIFEVIDGALLDPDKYLSKLSDWRDCSLWPTSSRQSEVIQRNVKQQADPLAKDGVVGTFCRAYSIEEAIETFLSDIYEPSAVAGRYDYIPADSSAGVVVYNNKFVYSHHATDPANGKLLNAFDLVRIHKFGELDDKASFKAMAELAVKDERVNVLLLEERQGNARLDFAESGIWTKGLQRDRGGQLMNNLHNLRLILENDPELEGIVFNQLSDGMEIKGDVPWQHPSRFWRDADDAQLISYIDAHYGTFSARNYDIAVAKVADDRSYHPIREFIEALPEWDGIPRVDTLLVDYIGASDNAYVRAVTRKTLCAAIARVLNPGIKFDSMLVLNGPQGVGKSTLIGKLGGEWFSDSLSLSDTKDKTAAEKLQGYWILEIGELAGLKKAEVETLRSFLSRQNDIYRASFGRRATPHLRQCVFFGTTNAEKGYLRDTTGNRRFWPVKTPGGGKKKSWQLTQYEVLQIWAEALNYVEAGEKLYLDVSLEKLAKDEQREAMESDEREGLIRDFLDMLLPEEWDSMGFYERRAFINGTEFGESQRVGIRMRTCVSNMEIWCECFGKDRANCKRMDSNEISAIMSGIGGWTIAPKKERIPLYGPQWVYVRAAVPDSVPKVRSLEHV